MAFQLSVAAAGDETNKINVIDERFAAETLRAIRGVDCGVLDNTFLSSQSTDTNIVRTDNPLFMFPLSYTSYTNITVGRGMATAYGFDMKSEQDYTFSATLPASGNKYVFIYLQWDFSDPQIRHGSIDMFDNGSNSVWTPQQDNLILIPSGKYIMPLWRITIDVANVTTIAAWNTLGVKGNATTTSRINGTTVQVSSIRTTNFTNNANYALSSNTSNILKNNSSSYVQYTVGTRVIDITW